MFRMSVICLILLLRSAVLNAQNLTSTEAVMRFLGSDDLLETDPDEVEKLEHLFDDKARINMLPEQERQGRPSRVQLGFSCRMTEFW